MCADHFRFKWGKTVLKNRSTQTKHIAKIKVARVFFLVRDVYVRKVSELYRRIQLLQAEM